MGICCVLFVGTAKCDMGPESDQRRLICFINCGFNGIADFIQIIPVFNRDHLPVICLKTK